MNQTSAKTEVVSEFVKLDSLNILIDDFIKKGESIKKIVIPISNIYNIGSNNLKRVSRAEFEKIASKLLKSSYHIELNCHSDNTGSNIGNLKLTEGRVNVLEKLFLENGLNADQITTNGYGGAYPIASDITAEGRGQNRRLEIILTKKGAHK